MYGENTGNLRSELTILLRQHRVQQRLGGNGLHTVPETTTAEERNELGQQIARYRHVVWQHRTGLQRRSARLATTRSND